jgi:hypothetical protein
VIANFGQFYKYYKSSPKCWPVFFPSIDYGLILTKNWRDYVLDDFFTNSSGNPGVDVMITIFCDYDFFTNSSGNPGVDVMITIFCDFCQFSAKKIGVFIKKPML